MNHVTTDVFIAGAGVVGLSAAIAMRQRGFSVVIIDAGPLDPSPVVSSARVYALNQASQRLLTTLKVWSDIDPAKRPPYQRMHVWETAHHACIDFDARMIGTDQLGVIVEETVLKEALLVQAMSIGVSLHAHQRIHTLATEPHGLQLQTQNHHWQTSLLIVAEGGQSSTRDQLGVSITTWPYHQHALVATIETEKPHQQTAYQAFTPDGPLAFLPLNNPYHCSIVWSTERISSLMALTDDDFAQTLTHAFEKRLGDCRLLSRRQTFPLHMRQATRYSGDHWLLMGDAAHTIHPLAGLGLNVSLADLTTWLSHLDATPNLRWSKRTLSAYQRQRKHAVWQTILVMDGLKTLFTNRLPGMNTVRAIGLNACDQWPLFKRFLIEHAQA